MKNSHRNILLFVVPLLLLLTLGAWWFVSPSWTSLFSYELSDESREEVVKALNVKNINYRINSSKSQIEVKIEDLKTARIYLSENNIPGQFGSGLEMFSDKDYGLSEFAQNINFQRGLEEELARTINKMENVKAARVHLTLKKESLFADRKKEPRASVVLSLSGNALFDFDKVRSIQEIVASAVPDLGVENVVVVTDKGDLLSAENSRTNSVKSQSSIEEKYNATLKHLLNEIVGEGAYKSVVTVQLDYKKRKTIAESYIPLSGDGKGFLVNKKMTIKQQDQSPGLKSSNGVNSTEEAKYVFSKEVSEIEYPLGEVVGISVGVAVSTGDDEFFERLGDLIESALGMDSDRGDKISIFKYSLNGSVEPAEKFIEDTTVGAVHVDSASDLVVNQEYPWQNDKRIIFALSLFLIILGIVIGLMFRKKPTNGYSSKLSVRERNEMLKELEQWMS